jgi:lipopolysaccharide export system protein LptC
VKKNSRILYVALLALVSLLVVFSTGVFERMSENTSPTSAVGKALPPELQGEPDVFMEQATITQFTPSGNPKYKLYSQQLRYFEREQLTRLAQPEMTLYTNQEALNEKEDKEQTQNVEKPWIIQSQHGYIRQRLETAPFAPASERKASSLANGNSVNMGREIVFLREDVKLSREDSKGIAMALKTQTLYIYPHRQFAETDQPVMIDSRVGRTKAAGFTGNLKTGILKLTSSNSQRVHTIVLPHQIQRKQ